MWTKRDSTIRIGQRSGPMPTTEWKEYMIATAAVARLKKKLAERIALVRGTRSQRQFARDLGVFQQSVNRYENDSIPPQLPHHTGYDSGHLPGLAAARKRPDGVGQPNWSRGFRTNVRWG